MVWAPACKAVKVYEWSMLVVESVECASKLFPDVKCLQNRFAIMICRIPCWRSAGLVGWWGIIGHIVKHDWDTVELFKLPPDSVIQVIQHILYCKNSAKFPGFKNQSLITINKERLWEVGWFFISPDFVK